MTEALALKRGNEVRVIANLPGRYMLANKRNMKGDRCEFACRIGNVSSAATVLAAPVSGPGPVRERVLAYSEAFGQLHGAITPVMSDGFILSSWPRRWPGSRARNICLIGQTADVIHASSRATPIATTHGGPLGHHLSCDRLL